MSTVSPLPAPVLCGIDALRVVMLGLAEPLEAETLAFALDSDGIGGVITVVSGTHDHDSVVAVVECMARAAALADVGLAGLVVASARPHSRVLPGDIDRWLDASSVAAAHGVLLLEWYVVSAAGVQCPRDLLGEPERWEQLRVGGRTQ